ncbi:MAG: hypothetical protein AAF512_00695 [Pseudomonadota bacterium]
MLDDEQERTRHFCNAAAGQFCPWPWLVINPKDSNIVHASDSFNELVGEEAKGQNLVRYIADGQNHPHHESMREYIDASKPMRTLTTPRLKTSKGRVIRIALRIKWFDVAGTKLGLGYIEHEHRL